MKKSKDYRELIRNMTREWKWLFRYIAKYRFIIFLYILLGVTGTVMSLGVTVASKYLIDAVVYHSDSVIVKYAVIVIGLAVFQYVFQALTSWITASVSSKTNNEIRHEIYSHILMAQWRDIGSFHSGDLINRLEGDVSVVSNGVISFIPSIFMRSVQFFGALAIVLYYDKTMAFLALMSAPFLFLSSRFLVRTMRRFNKESRDLNGRILSYSEESIQNIQIIKSFDLIKQYVNNFEKLLADYRSVKLSYDKFSIIMTLCLSLIGVIVSYACYGWGVYRLWQGAITFGVMSTFLQISGILTLSFGALASLAPNAVSIATSAGRIMEITSFAEETDADRAQAERVLAASVGKGVAFVCDSVTFRYHDADFDVLKDITLTVRPGETVALVGPSGEGKTTMLKLILGLMKPTAGEMHFVADNGESVEISDSTRRFCSFVPQSIGIFSGTVADNLRAVKPDASDDDIKTVLTLADLDLFVCSLPRGADTVIGEQGANFSQGQLQRLAIARALLRNSPVLLMDEATSALDIDTEKRVLENIMTADPDRICIITTHRESMLRYCDRVYRIGEDGRMTEFEGYEHEKEGKQG